MTDSHPERRNDFDEACRFIDALVRAMQLYGVLSQGMVASLDRVVKGLGLYGEFILTPTYVQTVLWAKEHDQQRVHLAVRRSGDYNLSKLERVMKISALVETGGLPPMQGVEQLREIEQSRDDRGPLWTALSFILSSAAFAVMLGASWMDVVVAGFVALASFGVTLAATRSSSVAALQEFVAAMLAAIMAHLAAVMVPGMHPLTVTVCAILWFIPGLAFTMAPLECMMGNTLSGVIWLTNAMMAALKLVGGAAMGMAIVQSAGVTVEPVALAEDMAPLWKWIAAVVLALALAVPMKVAWGRLWGVALGACLVWGAVQMGGSFGGWQGKFLGSAVLLIYARWYTGRFLVPAFVMLLPCVMLLVPGLPALRALHAAQTVGILAGLQQGYQVMILLAAIVGGVIVGDALAGSLPNHRREGNVHATGGR